MNRNAMTQGVRIGRTVTCVAALVVLAAVQAAAVEPPPSRKMTRQIEVLEKIIDQVLLDSPNFLIRGTPVARGTYLPGTGVLFTFDASLVDRDWDELDFKKWNFGRGFHVEEKDGQRVIIIDDEGEVLQDDVLRVRQLDGVRAAAQLGRVRGVLRSDDDRAALRAA